jgi:hypothetical protein
MRLGFLIFMAVAVWPAALVLEGCSCNAACALAEPTVSLSDTPSPVMQIVADPPCNADVTKTDGGVLIKVSLASSPDAGPPACALFAWLADGTELTARASFSKGDGPCCQDAYANGSVSPFVPVGSS